MLEREGFQEFDLLRDTLRLTVENKDLAQEDPFGKEFLVVADIHKLAVINQDEIIVETESLIVEIS